MLTNGHFYHQTIRRTVSVFGTIFNDIFVVRKDSAGATKDQMKVPLAYGPRQKFLARLEESPKLTDTSMGIKLPRMSFEITSMAYDPARQLAKTTKFSIASTTLNKKIGVYVAAPYTIGMQLNIMAKTQDDGLQIIEQIIPYFQPSYTVTIKNIPGSDAIKTDMPITLTGVTMADEYEGDFTQRRVIIYTLDFDIKTNFYGPVDGDQATIRTTKTDMNNIGSDLYLERVTNTTSLVDAGVDDNYGYTETYDFFEGDD